MIDAYHYTSRPDRSVDLNLVMTMPKHSSGNTLVTNFSQLSKLLNKTSALRELPLSTFSATRILVLLPWNVSHSVEDFPSTDRSYDLNLIMKMFKHSLGNTLVTNFSQICAVSTFSKVPWLLVFRIAERPELLVILVVVKYSEIAFK